MVGGLACSATILLVVAGPLLFFQFPNCCLQGSHLAHQMCVCFLGNCVDLGANHVAEDGRGCNLVRGHGGRNGTHRVDEVRGEGCFVDAAGQLVNGDMATEGCDGFLNH